MSSSTGGNLYRPCCSVFSLALCLACSVQSEATLSVPLRGVIEFMCIGSAGDRSQSGQWLVFLRFGFRLSPGHFRFRWKKLLLWPGKRRACAYTREEVRSLPCWCRDMEKNCLWHVGETVCALASGATARMRRPQGSNRLRVLAAVSA